MCVNCKFATRQFYIFYILYTVFNFNTHYKYHCFLCNLLALSITSMLIILCVTFLSSIYVKINAILYRIMFMVDTKGFVGSDILFRRF